MKTKLIGICGKDLFMADGRLAFKAGKEYEFIDSELAKENEFNERHGLGGWKTEFTFKWVNEFEEGDYLITKMGSIFIYKEKEGDSIWNYAYLGYTGMENFDISPACHSSEVIGLATPEQIKKMDKVLADKGKRWDAKLKKIVDLEYVPKEGDVVVNGNGSIYIYKTGCNSVIDNFYASFYEGSFYTSGLARRNNTRLATYEERCKFFERLVKEGYKWDSRKLKLTKVGLRPEDMKRGEFYKIITDSGNEWVVLFDKLNGSEVKALSACVLKSTSIYHGQVLCYVSEIAKITPASKGDIEFIKNTAAGSGCFFNGKAFEKGFDSWVNHVKGSYSERFLSGKVKQLNAILNERD